MQTIKDVNARYYKKLYVEDSSISGKGLFAGENIYQGELILSFGGVFALQADRYNGSFIRSTFTGITDVIMLCEDSSSEKDISDYINHSCDPNVGMFDCLTIIAIKDIILGSEIVCDYAFWEAREDWILKYPCACGSISCRCKISGVDWKKISSSDEKFKYFSPFLKRRILHYEQKL